MPKSKKKQKIQKPQIIFTFTLCKKLSQQKSRTIEMSPSPECVQIFGRIEYYHLQVSKSNNGRLYKHFLIYTYSRHFGILATGKQKL